jgi:hypothetical protein
MSDRMTTQRALVEAADDLERVAAHASCAVCGRLYREKPCDLADHHEGHAAIAAYRRARKAAGARK